MKAIMLATQNLQTGIADCMVAGGMESLSNVPFYLNRGEVPYGGAQLIVSRDWLLDTTLFNSRIMNVSNLFIQDGVAFDGLLDVYNKIHMGLCGENTAKKMSITRNDQDDYALRSYKLSAAAYKDNIIQKELVEVRIPQKKGTDKLISVF